MNDQAKKLATYLHDEMCTFSHNDQCGWFYHEHNWDEYSHRQYYKSAIKILENVTFVDAVDTIEDYKKLVEMMK